MSWFGLFVLHFYFICVLLFVCLTFFVLSEVERLGGTFLAAGALASQTPAAHLIISDSSKALVFYFHSTPDCVFHSSRWCTVTLLAFTFSDLLALASLCEPTRLTLISPLPLSSVPPCSKRLFCHPASSLDPTADPPWSHSPEPSPKPRPTPLWAPLLHLLSRLPLPSTGAIQINSFNLLPVLVSSWVQL